MNEEIIQLKEFNFLGKSGKFSGHFSFAGITRLSAECEGEFYMQTPDALIIEPEGQIHGKINCNDLEIYGHFSGEVMAKGKVIIYPSAVVEGRIWAHDLCIYPGSVVTIEGHTL